MRYAKFIIGAIVFALAAWGAFHFFESSGSVSVSNNSSQATSSVDAPAFPDVAAGPAAISSSPAAAAPAPAGWQLYQNASYHLSLYYPPELSVKTYDEGGGAMTIAFQSKKPVEGFQIFIVPYSGSQISEARFKQDEPSGVRQGVQNANIGGVQAVTFYSTNPMLGDTAEVWFIYPEQGRGTQSYLFEVTTLKPLAQWFSQIMQTWQFI